MAIISGRFVSISDKQVRDTLEEQLNHVTGKNHRLSASQELRRRSGVQSKFTKPGF